MHISYPNFQSAEFRLQYLTINEILSKFPPGESSAKPVCSSAKARYIEGVLVGMPQSPIYVDTSTDDFYVFEGDERIKAFFDFCTRKLPLQHTYYKTKLFEDKTFSELPVSVIRSFMDTKIPVYFLNPGASPFIRYGAYLSVKRKVDAETKKNARSHIFNNYHLIEEFAGKFSSNPKNFKQPIIELIICNALIAYIANQDKMRDQIPVHLEVIANSFLLSPEFPDFFAEVQDDLATMINKSFAVSSIYSDNQINSFLAVNIILKLQGKRPMNVTSFQNRIKNIKGALLKRTDYLSYCQRILSLCPNLFE